MVIPAITLYPTVNVTQSFSPKVGFPHRLIEVGRFEHNPDRQIGKPRMRSKTQYDLVAVDFRGHSAACESSRF